MHEGPSEGNDMVQDLEEVLHIGELENGHPAMLVMSELIVDDHEEADEHVGRSHTSKTDKGLLSDTNPWRVTHT